MKYLIAAMIALMTTSAIAGPWELDQSFDQFQETTTAYAYSDEVEPTEALGYPYDTLKVRLVMKCSTESPFAQGSFRFSINPTLVGGHPDYTRGPLDSTYDLKVRFDNGKLLSINAGKNATKKDVVVYSNIVSEVRNKYSLKVKFNIYDQDALYEIDLEDSRKTINKMLNVCNK